jgi:hypothetical protein
VSSSAFFEMLTVPAAFFSSALPTIRSGRPSLWLASAMASSASFSSAVASASRPARPVAKRSSAVAIAARTSSAPTPRLHPMPATIMASPTAIA